MRRDQELNKLALEISAEFIRLSRNASGFDLGRTYHFDMARVAMAAIDRMEFGRGGRWGLDPERPFGSTDPIGDVLEILDMDPYDEPGRPWPEYSDKQKAYATRVLLELGNWLRGRPYNKIKEDWEKML